MNARLYLYCTLEIMFEQIDPYLNQSTFVLGWGNITYTEEEEPDNDFFMSDGHMMNGSGKFEVHVGAGYLNEKH